MECMELKICMSDKHHRYYKHTKFRQNPRGDPKFLVDLTWNDPYIISVSVAFFIMAPIRYRYTEKHSRYMVFPITDPIISATLVLMKIISIMYIYSMLGAGEVVLKKYLITEFIKSPG